MARVVICEPVPEIRELLQRVIARMGHEPVTVDAQLAADQVDVLLAEPAEPHVLEQVRRLKRERPGLPLIFVSIRPAAPETRELEPAAHLVKPFDRQALEAAVSDVLTV